jgi:hypothetical protein
MPVEFVASLKYILNSLRNAFSGMANTLHDRIPFISTQKQI